MLVTCEHGGNRLPICYGYLFRGREKSLENHRAYDIGALGMARALAGELKAALFYSTITRLLIDLNRSARNPRVFSKVSGHLPAEERRVLLSRYHEPYRNRIEGYIRKMFVNRGSVIHISVHTFSPRLNGLSRNADIGLLYDPSREREKNICLLWKKAILEVSPELRVRRNYPYLGVSDGLATYLRRQFNENVYAGIELEINQRVIASENSGRRKSVISAISTLGNLAIQKNIPNIRSKC